MFTLFENFNENNIRKYIVNNQVPSVSFKYLNPDQLKYPKYKPMTYETLMRLCTFIFLINYKGNDPKLNEYIKSLKSFDNPKKHEIINKFGRSRKTLNAIKYNILRNFKCDIFSCDDPIELEKFISNYDIIFTEENVLDFIKRIEVVTEKSDKGESIVADFLSTYFYKTATVIKPGDESIDLGDVDLLKIDKENGSKQTIQVKTISYKTTTLKLDNNVIYINNTDFDMHSYNQNTKPLKYDYLAIYDDCERRLYYISSKAILRIDVTRDPNTNKRNIVIIIGKWALKYKSYFNIFKISAKYAGVNLSKIFY